MSALYGAFVRRALFMFDRGLFLSLLAIRRQLAAMPQDLMHVHANIRFAVHKGVPFRWLESTAPHPLRKGAPFYNAFIFNACLRKRAAFRVVPGLCACIANYSSLLNFPLS
jgi:hypothetical protein